MPIETPRVHSESFAEFHNLRYHYKFAKILEKHASRNYSTAIPHIIYIDVFFAGIR